jgi:brefeldin A-resistance guanine nucleotide exchange factor 1
MVSTVIETKGYRYFLLTSSVVLRVEDIMNVAPLDLLQPFLALVRSPLTSGPITSLSLTALNSICSNVLPLYLPTPLPELSPALFTPSSRPQSPLQIALGATTSALARCRFPSSTPAQDELVLSRLLRVTETIISSKLERELTDEGVCEMLEVGLGMGGRARLGGKLGHGL